VLFVTLIVSAEHLRYFEIPECEQPVTGVVATVGHTVENIHNERHVRKPNSGYVRRASGVILGIVFAPQVPVPEDRFKD